MTGALRIGELARATGLTVRTLRHYEAVGLLEPVERSESGYRLYRAKDAERLYAIVALRRLGLTLAEIRSALAPDTGHLRAMVLRHLGEVRRRLVLLGELEGALERLQGELDPAQAPSLAELCELVRLTAEAPPPRRLGDEPAAIRALADPTSALIFDRLHRHGPATVSALARAIGEAPADVERRVEELARHRFVERQGERAGAWRAVSADLRLPQVERTPESDEVARSWFEPGLRALARFVEDEDEWAESATLSHAMLHLTRDELERFGAEYVALVRRYGRPVEQAPRGARMTTALLFAFPRDD